MASMEYESNDQPLPPRPPLRRWTRRALALCAGMLLSAIIGGPLAVALEDAPVHASWREARAASIRSAGLAPSPSEASETVIQAYAARTWGAKKAFAVHTWLAIKSAGASSYEVHHVMGWRRGRGLPVVVAEQAIPDRPWYGNPPQLLLELRGNEYEPLIAEIRAAAASYPWQRDYRAWPGPNSNTFIAWIGRQVPALGLDLPSTAIGKDFVPLGDALGPSVSGSGMQASLLGVAGISAGIEQGLELNILGLNLEFDLFDLAIEVPGYGRIGKPQVSTEG